MSKKDGEPFLHVRAPIDTDLEKKIGYYLVDHPEFTKQSFVIAAVQEKIERDYKPKI